jgi:NADH-quinone oxidoreductase B subunit
MIGIDISDRSVKVAELVGKQQPRLRTICWSALPPNLIRRGVIQDIPAVTAALRESFTKCSPTSLAGDAAVASIPETQSFVRILDLPDMSGEEMDEAVKWAVRQHIPFDLDRFGIVPWPSPRQCDVMIVAGTVTKKMGPAVKLLYQQMPNPKWVISMGACASCGGMFNNYAILQGVDKIVAVDIHVPGCPPRPEAVLYGFNKLQRMIVGNPDPGWRARYKASGTEEWARDDVIAGQPSEAALAAYGRAREAATDPRHRT